jgi:hypothetical protein
MIKWIGQHIVSLIARFRDDVYLENLEEQTQDHVVGIDDDGKLYKQDRGTTDSFTVEDGDTTDVVISNGKHWKFVEGGNIDINWTDTSTGSSSDEYDLTFGVSTRPSFEVVELISPYTIESRESVKIQVDSANTANANHVFDFVNGAGDTIGKLDKDGNLSIKGELRTLSAGGKGDLGEFVEANIPNLNASKVNDGTFADARIPSLGASKVTSGTFADARIPDLGASKVTSGTFADARIPDLGASKVTSGTFADARIPDLNVSKLTAGTLSEARGGTGVADVKQIITRQAFQCNFIDDIGTTKHYLPLAGILENTVRYQDEAAMLAPCDGRVASVTLKMENLGGASGNITFGVEVAENPGTGFAQTWTTVETETFAIGSGDNHDTFHFHFTQSTAGANSGTSKHFDATMMWAISIQSDDASLGGDGGNDERWFVTAVVEWDWSTYLGTKGTTTKYTSVP